MLKTKLSDAELRYLEKQLAEEGFSVAMLEFMASSTLPKGHADTPE